MEYGAEETKRGLISRLDEKLVAPKRPLVPKAGREIVDLVLPEVQFERLINKALMGLSQLGLYLHQNQFDVNIIAPSESFGPETSLIVGSATAIIGSDGALIGKITLYDYNSPKLKLPDPRERELQWLGIIAHELTHVWCHHHTRIGKRLEKEIRGEHAADLLLKAGKNELAQLLSLQSTTPERAQIIKGEWTKKDSKLQELAMGHYLNRARISNESKFAWEGFADYVAWHVVELEIKSGGGHTPKKFTAIREREIRAKLKALQTTNYRSMKEIQEYKERLAHIEKVAASKAPYHIGMKIFLQFSQFSDAVAFMQVCENDKNLEFPQRSAKDFQRGAFKKLLKRIL